jgi:FMN phosphatase YigB (HAD superfamily)
MSTLLIDLDNTLLQNPVDLFVPAYIKLFSSYVSDFMDPKLFSHTLLAATDQMIANEDIQRSLQSTFEEHFYPSFIDQKEALVKVMNDFYTYQYPTLRSYTHTRPEAIKLINEAIVRGSNIVIATNPLFPLSVQLQRLSWAGLSEDQYPSINFVTSYEKLHFAKPNPAYYAEILALLGWPDDPINMIGDTFSEDILPCSSMGISSFFIQNEKFSDPEISSSVPFGTLTQAAEWLRFASSRLQFDSKISITAALKGSSAALDTISQNRQGTNRSINLSIENALIELFTFDQEMLSSLIQIKLQLAENSPINQFFLLRKEMISMIDRLSDKDFTVYAPNFLKIIRNDQLIFHRLFAVFSSISPLFIKSILS